MKNEWIPILPEHDATRTDDERILLSSSANQAIPEDDGDEPTTADPGADDEAYIPDRFGTPEDIYDDDTGSTEAADPNSKNSDDVKEDIDFDIPASAVSLRDLAELTSRLQARHTEVQGALKAATAATREAAANVFEMMARVEKEKARIKAIMGTVYDIVGECDEQSEPSEEIDEEVDEEGERNTVSEKRKGKEKTTRSSARSSFRRENNLAGLHPSPLCPNCRVARDLTVSQRHSVYLCAEHMPNPYQANEASNKDSQVPSLSSNSSLPGPSSSRDSTIIFGLTTKSAATSPKGKKRSLEDDSHSTSNNQSPKRARVEGSQNDTPNSNTPQDSSLTSSPVPTEAAPLTRTKSVCESNKQEVKRRGSEPRSGTPLSAPVAEKSLPRRNVPSTRITSPGNFNVPEVFASTERRPSTPRRNAPLRRTASVADINNAEEIANAEREESLEKGPTQRTQSSEVNDLMEIARQEPPTSRRNAPLRRTISIHDLNDLEEVANAERVENSLARGTAGPGPMVSIDGEEPAIVHSYATWTNPPLRRAYTMIDINDPVEAASVEELATARATPQGPGVDVSRRVRERLTASAESTSSGSSSNIIRGKRARDSDGDEEERMQKKTRIADASN